MNDKAKSFDRVFSVDELRVNSMRSVDALAETLEQADDERAVFYSKRLRYETLAMLSSYDGWEESLLNWIERREDRATVDALRSRLARELEGQCPASASDKPEEHLRELAREVAVAIEDKDRERALVFANKLQGAALAHHDRGMSRVTAILSWVGGRYDVELLEEAMTESMAGDLLGDASFRERAEALMHYTRVHLHAFELEEDEEKLTFTCPVCCCHEPAIEIASIRKTGVPMFIVEPSENLGVDPCKTYLYKNPADIPDRFYERLRLNKPIPKPRPSSA